MNNDPSLNKADISDVDDQLRAEAPDTEGHVRFQLDEQGNPDVARPDDSEDTEGHKRF